MMTFNEIRGLEVFIPPTWYTASKGNNEIERIDAGHAVGFQADNEGFPGCRFIGPYGRPAYFVEVLHRTPIINDKLLFEGMVT